MADENQTLSPEEAQALRDQLTSLTWERDQERRRAETEAARADSLQSRVVEGDKRLAQSTVAGIQAQEQGADAAIAAIDQELTGLKRALAGLNAEGKFEEAADVQVQIGDATARRHAAVQAKDHWGRQRERTAAEPVDPVDRFLTANPQYTEAERDWIKKNPRYATDRDFHMRVNSAHQKAIEKGLRAHSPEYFAVLEQEGYQRVPTPATPAPARPTASARTEPVWPDSWPTD